MLHAGRIETCDQRTAIHLRKLGRVPKLGREVAITLDTRLRQLDVAPLRRHRGQRHTQRVGAELVHQLQRIDGVAERLRHLAPLLVTDERVDVDVLKWNLAHEVDALHHHAGDPEEDDVERRHQHGARIKFLQRRIDILRPAHRRERPQRGGEPRVEDVFVLPKGHNLLVIRAQHFCPRNIAIRGDRDLPIAIVGARQFQCFVSRRGHKIFRREVTG